MQGLEKDIPESIKLPEEENAATLPDVRRKFVKRWQRKDLMEEEVPPEPNTPSQLKLQFTVKNTGW